MSDISRVFNTAKETLLSNLTAINVTSSNIANVNTAGYSRLRPVFGAVRQAGAGVDSLQVGVRITNVERIYDRYLEEQLVQQQQEVGYNDTCSDLLGRVEEVFNESSVDGLSDLMNQFWGAWSDLSANPSDKGERDVLASVAGSLASAFRQYSSSLTSLQSDANEGVADQVSQLNAYLTDMAVLNQQIVQSETGGMSADNLKDQRTELLKSIGTLVDIQYFEEADGGLNVFLSNGTALVQGATTFPLMVKDNPSNSNLYDVVAVSETDVSLNSAIRGGKIGGFLEIRDIKIPEYMKELDAVASALISAVNTAHQSGYDVNGDAGVTFFLPAATAKGMVLNPAIEADSAKIAASATVNGDGDKARSIATLQDSLLMSGGRVTISSYYSSFLATIGQDAAGAANAAERQQAISSQLVSQRESVSGVSLDEEMLSLIKYQAGYNAAGKLCGVVNEMLDTLMALGE